MFESLKYSNLAIKASLAIVFLWLGIDKLVHPDYWISLWYPSGADGLLSAINLSPGESVGALSIIEILVGVSLVTGIYSKIFSIVGIFFIVITNILFGFGYGSIKDLALVCAFLSLITWPSRRTI